MCFNVGITENTTDVRTLLLLLLQFLEAALPQELRVRYLTYFCHFSTLQRRKLRLRAAKVTALEILEHPGHYFPHALCAFSDLVLLSPSKQPFVREGGRR